MKVYLGKTCYDNGCDIWKTVEKVFDDETKAIVWVEELVPDGPYEFREYEEMDLE